MRNLTAKKIDVYRAEGRMAIEWGDGHKSSYALTGLRGVCPCVECRGGHENMGQPVGPYSMEESVFKPVELSSIEAAGSYALRIQWSDGHGTGIYTWSFLRDLCPCEACRRAADAQKATGA